MSTVSASRGDPCDMYDITSLHKHVGEAAAIRPLAVRPDCRAGVMNALIHGPRCCSLAGAIRDVSDVMPRDIVSIHKSGIFITTEGRLTTAAANPHSQLRLNQRESGCVRVCV